MDTKKRGKKVSVQHHIDSLTLIFSTPAEAARCNNMTGFFNGIARLENNKLFSHWRFTAMASCIQITLQHQSISASQARLFQVWGADVFPQISVCTHLTARLMTSEKRTRCKQMIGGPHFSFPSLPVLVRGALSSQQIRNYRWSCGCSWTVIIRLTQVSSRIVGTTELPVMNAAIWKPAGKQNKNRVQKKKGTKKIWKFRISGFDETGTKPTNPECCLKTSGTFSP